MSPGLGRGYDTARSKTSGGSVVADAPYDSSADAPFIHCSRLSPDVPVRQMLRHMIDQLTPVAPASSVLT